MKLRSLQVAAAIALAAVLVSGALYLVQLGTRPDSGGEALVSSLGRIEARLGALEQGLAEVDRLRAEVGDLRREAARLASARRDRSNGGTPERMSSEGPADAGNARDEDIVAAVERMRAEGGEDGLRTYIAEVVEEQRQERVAQAQEAAAQRRAEIAALHEGPYGAHNFKVNTMSQRLDFADYQKQRYHDLLLAYTDRITVSREEEDLDQENRQRYRDRRSELRKQFVSEVTNILEPDQAEVFAALPEFEQRPDGTARFVFATAGDAGEMNTLIEERIMGVGADGLLEPGAARLGVKVHLERAGEALEKVIRATSVSGEAGVETKDVEVEIDTLPEVAPQ